jgi:homogentisate 1,2-dioxygenase
MPDLKYFTGFGNEFATEAHPGGLPVGQNARKKPRSASTLNSSPARPLRHHAIRTGAPGPTVSVHL